MRRPPVQIGCESERTSTTTRGWNVYTNTPQNTVPAVDNATLPETAFRSIVAEKAHANRRHTGTSIDPMAQAAPQPQGCHSPIVSARCTAARICYTGRG